MNNYITIVMYHYIRELPLTRFPKIKGLLFSQFENQLKYFLSNYSFITIKDCISAYYGEHLLPENPILLTFDDGYIEHYTKVFPLLNEYGIQGCFFPSAGVIVEDRVLNVNKIHFILAACKDNLALLDEIFVAIDNYRSEYSLEERDYYIDEYARPSRYDDKYTVLIKKLLQVGLEKELTDLILTELFYKYVTEDEAAFSRELYVSIDQLKCMHRNGMYIGSHGYNHHHMDTLEAREQEYEIDRSLEFLKIIGTNLDQWVIAYPYGSYDESLIQMIKTKNCAMGLTTRPNLTSLQGENSFTMERLDTNDFPKSKIYKIY